MLGLPLEQRDVGDGGLERALERLIAVAGAAPAAVADG